MQSASITAMYNEGPVSGEIRERLVEAIGHNLGVAKTGNTSNAGAPMESKPEEFILTHEEISSGLVMHHIRLESLHDRIKQLETSMGLRTILWLATVAGFGLYLLLK